VVTRRSHAIREWDIDLGHLGKSRTGTDEAQTELQNSTHTVTAVLETELAGRASRMTSEPLVRAGIQENLVRSSLLSTWWTFDLVDAEERRILVSREFKSVERYPRNEQQAREVLQELLDKIRDQGWSVIRIPDLQARTGWWKYEFAKGSREQIERAREFVRATEPRNLKSTGNKVSRSVWIMWAVTVSIVILLFACCVVLVATSEIRFSPAN
jgi:hypothetical protein